MSFAYPPLGDLRLQVPQSLNLTWNGFRNATEYGYGCIGFGEDTEVASYNYTSEDCLTVNAICPSGYGEGDDLPILVWIYGGGFLCWHCARPTIQLDFYCQGSVKRGKPIVAESLNYRLAAYGFLWSSDILANNVSNLGLRDQRLALHWFQESIRGFGGDPKKTTIWGESAYV